MITIKKSTYTQKMSEREINIVSVALKHFLSTLTDTSMPPFEDKRLTRDEVEKLYLEFQNGLNIQN